MRRILAILVALAFVPTSLAVLPAPSLGVRLPYSLSDAPTAVAGDVVYVLGGLGGSGFDPGTPEDHILRFDAATSTLTTIEARLPGGRWFHAGAQLGDDVYLFGGVANVAGGRLDEIVRFDVATHEVEVLPTRLPWTWTDGAAAAHGGKIYVFGGRGAAVLDTILRFDPADGSLVQTDARLPSPASGFSAVTLGDSIYLTTGQRLLRYDPAADAIHLLGPSLPNERFRSGVATDGDKIYLLGGLDQPGFKATSDILRYDPATDALALMARTTPSLVWWGDAGVSRSATAFAAGTIYAFGGFTRWSDQSSRIIAYHAGADLPNERPVAVVVPTPVEECTDGGADVVLDASGSHDPEGDAFSALWRKVPFWSTFRFSDDRALAAPAWAPHGVTSLILDLDDGYHTTTVWSSVTVRDTVPPVATLARPVPGTTYVFDEPVSSGGDVTTAIGALTFEVDADEACGIASLAVRDTVLDATVTGTTAPFAVRYVPPAGHAGPVEFELTVTDLGGNTATLRTTVVLVGTRVVEQENRLHDTCAEALPEAACVSLVGEDPYPDW